MRFLKPSWLVATALTVLVLRNGSHLEPELPPPAAAPPKLPPSPWPMVAWVIPALLAAAVGWAVVQSWADRRESEAVARALTGGEPDRAPAIAIRYGCGACHSIPGIAGADGQVGPPLAGLRRRVIIAGLLPNTAPNLVDWIVDPRRFSPGNAMPATGISVDEARDVAAYLYAY